MRRFATILHVTTALACLALTTQLKDPHLLPLRAYETPALILIALVGLAISLRRKYSNSWQQALLPLVWLTALTAVAYGEYALYRQKQTVSSAMGDDDIRLKAIGEHLIVGYDNPHTIRELAQRGYIAGLFVTRRNAAGKNFEQLRQELADLQLLRRQSGLPPLILASDQEGGPVSRLSPPLPHQPALASLIDSGLSPTQIEQRAVAYGAEQGRALAALGINLNLSPVVDLKPAPDHVDNALDFHTRIAQRAIAAEPETVARIALAYSRGLLMHGVLPTVKHFPGLSQATEDTHHFSAHLKLSTEELNARDWRPFRLILGQTEALAMIGHVIVDAIDPEYPASLSRTLIDGELRKKWRHEGILIGDDMTMAAVYNRGLCRSSILSLNAGIDLLLIAYDWEKIYPVLDCLQQADKSGQLRTMESSRRRLQRLPWSKQSEALRSKYAN